MIIQILKDTEKNLSLIVRGFARSNFGPELILDLEKVRAPREGWKGVRLETTVWLIEEKMGLYLLWGDQISEENLAIPMESRNSLRFDEGYPSPRVADGWGRKLYVSSFNFTKDNSSNQLRSFFLLIDLDKQ